MSGRFDRLEPARLRCPVCRLGWVYERGRMPKYLTCARCGRRTRVADWIGRRVDEGRGNEA